MPDWVVLRKLDNKNRWKRLSWMPDGAVQADALQCLKTTSNTLSVYYVDDKKTRLEPLIAALCATRDSFAFFDFALLDAEKLRALQIRLNEQKPGTTPDSEVNQWHVNLEELTAEKLVQLAAVIMASGSVKRLHFKEVMRMINHSVQAGRMDGSALSGGLREKLDDGGPSSPA